MRIISFWVHGALGGDTEMHGTVAHLFASLPHRFSRMNLPPLPIVNDLLKKGVQDAGMSGGCKWQPFELTESEWNDAVKLMFGDQEVASPEPPAGVDSYDDWLSWSMMLQFGFPDNFLELDRAYRALASARQKAVEEGNQALVEELHVRVIEAGMKLAELVPVRRPSASPPVKGES